MDDSPTTSRLLLVPGVEKHYRMPMVMIACCLLLISIEIILVIVGLSVAFLVEGNLPYQIQLASTLVSLILIVCETVTISHCIHSLIVAKDLEAKRKCYLVRQKSIEEKCEEVEEKPTEVIDQVENMALTSWRETELRELSRPWTLALMLSLTGLNVAFTLVCWGLTVASVHYNAPVTNVFYFILTDLVLGILCPLLFMLSIIVLMKVIQSITCNRVLMEGIAPIFLSFLSYKQGKKFCYWVIIDTFYFRVKKTSSSDQIDHNSSNLSMTRNPSTWCIFIIITLTFVMVVSVFVSETVTKKTRYNKCQDAVNSGEISCFVEPRYNHINCSEDSSFQKTDIACFQFLLIGVSSDPVQAIVEAVFLYIGCDKFLTALFHLIKGLLSLKKTICWAVIVLATGVALILMQFIQFAIAFSLTSDLDLLNMIKYFVLNCNILLAGILLLIGSPMEKIDTNLKEQNNELHLISFSDADTVI